MDSKANNKTLRYVVVASMNRYQHNVPTAAFECSPSIVGCSFILNILTHCSNDTIFSPAADNCDPRRFSFDRFHGVGSGTVSDRSEITGTNRRQTRSARLPQYPTGALQQRTHSTASAIALHEPSRMAAHYSNYCRVHYLRTNIHVQMYIQSPKRHTNTCFPRQIFFPVEYEVFIY